ncbi:hypothetical protein ACFLTE_00720 [Bacteroidota bacterium]
MKRIYSLLITVIITVIVLGQAPESFKYQAVLRDADGDPLVNESISIELAILQGSSAGTEVFSETHSITTNTFGLVNIEIGSVNSIDFAAIDWAAGPYYIEITLDGSVMGTPSQLLSVPYALYAGNNGCCVWNKVGNNIDYMPGNVSIGTESNWASLNVGGQVNFEPGTRTWGSQVQLNASSLDHGMNYQLTSTGGDAVEGQGKLLITNTKYGHAMVIDSTLNISMGTETNWAKLNINGMLNVEPGENSWGSQLILNSDSLAEGSSFMLTSTAGDAAEGNSKLIIGSPPYNSIVPTPFLTFDTLGNLGVGTVNPTTRIHIGDYDTYSGYGGGKRDWMQRGLSISWDTDNMYVGLKDEGVDQKEPVIAFGDNHEDKLKFIYTDQDSVTEIEIARFTALGNVGIGTINPMANLHVGGLGDGDIAKFGKQESEFDSMVVINKNGNVGIGALTASQKLQIQVNNNGLNIPLFIKNLDETETGGNAVGIGFTNEPGGDWIKSALAHERKSGYGIGTLHLLVNNDIDETHVDLADSRMSITSEGNVGIGNTEPASKLQVADGDVYVETIGTGVIIKSPDGNCWRLTVDNTGALATESVSCP